MADVQGVSILMIKQLTLVKTCICEIFFILSPRCFDDLVTWQSDFPGSPTRAPKPLNTGDPGIEVEVPGSFGVFGP